MAMPKLEPGLPGVTVAVVMTGKLAANYAGFCSSNRVISMKTLGKIAVLGCRELLASGYEQSRAETIFQR
jgi:hypothetical protein